MERGMSVLSVFDGSARALEIVKIRGTNGRF